MVRKSFDDGHKKAVENEFESVYHLEIFTLFYCVYIYISSPLAESTEYIIYK